ncbi:MAG: ABC transporter permease [Adhaeribacter sp.]
MIRHLFTLIWNRKKSNFLMITEIFFSFVVLFGVLSLGFYYLDNYRQDLGFRYERVWVMTMHWNQESDQEVIEIQRQLKQRLKDNPQVEGVALSSSNAPYTMNTSNSSFSYGNRKAQVEQFQADQDYDRVMGLKLTEGRWFGRQDMGSGYVPMVINEALRQELFPGEQVIGKVLPWNFSDGKGDKAMIVGVISGYRQKGEYAPLKPAAFQFADRENQPSDRTAAGFLTHIMIRVRPGVSRAFEETLMKQASAIAKGWTLELETMDEMRASSNKLALVPLVVFSVVCGFLIINVALGLFGVLWYNINRRISEIGLRRAIGAASGQVYRQFVGEVLVLATFGTLAGLLVAAQFPLLNVFGLQPGIYLAAMAGAVVAIYLLAAGCAAYPSRQAAGIAPATALHEE